MDKLTKLCQDVVLLWDKYHVLYLNGVKNTLVLALVATAIGCVIGLVCGVLNTIPYTKNDPLPKRFLLKLLRIVIRVYVEVFRGTPMVLQDGLTDAQRDILSSGITVITDDIAAPDEAPADELDGADDSMDGFWVQYGYAIVVMMLCMMSTAFLLRAVVEEKESKLVELLMVSVSPLALLGGKILAVMLYVAALLLLVLFGMGGSVLLAGLLFGPGTGAEALSAVLPYLTGADGGILHAVGTVLVVLVSLLLAYLTLSVVAGIAGACCSNMEDVGSANGAVLLIVMGGYLVSCVVGVVPSHGLAVFASLCPILSLFCAPVQWAAGNVPLAVLLASWALQLIVIAALMLLCARVYRELIVHRGSRVKLKQLLKMAKGGAQA